MSGGVPAGEIAKERADWLLDAVAAATQDRRYLRGDPEYNEWAGEAILLNGEKAILVAIDRATPTPPIEGRDADVERDREVLREAVKAASVAEVCAILATHYDSRGNAQIANGLAPTAHRVSRAYEQHLVAIRAAIQALGERG